MLPLPKLTEVTAAVILAAGTGSRLAPLTDTAPKCLTEVNGIPILKQQMNSLLHCGVEELVVVLGHMGEQIREFLRSYTSDLKISYIRNSSYKVTNNLYSLWLARNVVARPFVLLESDLFFEPALLEGMMEPDRIAVAPHESWMRGTTVTLDESQNVVGFQMGSDAKNNATTYKTVNIYSLSVITWDRMRSILDSYVAAGRVNDYYEAVFRDMAAQGTLAMQAVSFAAGKWYEVDTPADLRACEALFACGETALSAPATTPPESTVRVLA